MFGALKRRGIWAFGTGAERKSDESLTQLDSGFVRRYIYAWRPLAYLYRESFEAFGA
ncbi:hypothetical protein [Rhizobium sp. EC-SD404]|uniref:hypothetical protein n=1 Tax=Rhizobium sp. EC-SD404 TaxID=2038389 RepID=UPI0018FEC813|nr:hypothetical protein [Rhizobium sp. EC-SD404]